MKFIKHFTDAHRGKSLLAVRRELGMAGIGMYWTLVELCGEKLEKLATEEYSEAHCHFEFEVGYFCQKLGTRPTYVRKILDIFQTSGLLLAESSEYEIKISMPKLLESLDRDSKRARQERAGAAPKRKRKNKREEKEYIHASAFDRLSKKYLELFKGTVVGPALERFKTQMTDLTKIAELELAMDNYRKVLDANEWRQPKTTFAIFLGTKTSGFFWRDFLTLPDLPAKQSLESLELTDYSTKAGA